MFNAIDISTSGLVAQRIRINTTAMNIAAADVVFDPAEGGPYRRRAVKFGVGMGQGDRSGQGVHVTGIDKQDAYRWKLDPYNPYASEDGYVRMPDINTFVETVNAMEAQRAYEANLAAMEVSKSLINNALRILA